MRRHFSIFSIVIFTFLVQNCFINKCDGTGPQANIIGLQQKVEELIERIIRIVQDYYNDTEGQYRCLPEHIPDQVIEAVKNSIDCVERSHRDLEEGSIEYSKHRKEFLKCFVSAKREVNKIMKGIKPKLSHCPPNATERTYQINVTTSYTKTFNVNIKNGIEVLENRTIEVTRKEPKCFNYPDVFTPDDDEEESPEPSTHQSEASTRVPTAPTLDDSNDLPDYDAHEHHEDDFYPKDELTTTEDDYPETTTLRPSRRFADKRLRTHKPHDEVPYTYYHEFQSGGDSRDYKTPEERNSYRKKANRKDRYTEKTSQSGFRRHPIAS